MFRFVIPVVMLVSYLALSSGVVAENLRSTEYAIESGTFDYQIDDKKAEGNYNLSSGLGEGIRKQFRERGYAIYTYLSSAKERSYTRASLDRSQLVFRDAESSDEASETVRVTVESNAVSDPTISVFQEGQFSNSFGQSISPMRCNEKQPCTLLAPVRWVEGSGLGYSTDRTAYRPFFIGGSEASKQAVLPLIQKEKNQSATVTVMLKPGSEIGSGLYRGTIIFTIQGEL